MSELREFRLPDVGEGLTEAEIVTWFVKPGDTVTVNQMIVEIETAKASVELPCPFAGVVSRLHADPGDIVPVGESIITIEVAANPTDATTEKHEVLVGYGVQETSTAPKRRPRSGSAPKPHSTPAKAQAKPPVRKLARELGVDLADVAPTGPRGDVTRDDVVRASQTPDVGGEERIPVRGVMRTMADAMVASAFTAPHVTAWVDVDMSRSMELLTEMRNHPRFRGIRVTPLTLVAAGLVRAALEFPAINSTWAEDHVVIKKYVNLGIAADTPRGLLVPNIKSAHTLPIRDLAIAINSLVESARSGHSTANALTGGTITITNIGVFGLDGGTPIINPGEAAILAMGRVLDRPWAVDGHVVVRPIMQLLLSFDHRMVDGGLGARVLNSVATFLNDPAVALALDS